MNTTPSPAMTSSLHVGLTQWHVGRDMNANLRQALRLIEQTADAGAQLICLPENCLFLGTNVEMRNAALTLHSAPIEQLRAAACRVRVPVVLGGFKHRSQHGLINNTALVIDSYGGLAGHYDKIHLFDATVAGQSFEASSVESRGSEPVLLSVAGVSIGLTICYDVRFPELYRKLALAGAEVLLVPAAFTYTTGQAHWEVLLRARAIENSAYLVAPATVRGDVLQKDAFETWGHALVVDPWGAVLANLQSSHCASQVVALDLQRLRDIRSKLPVLAGIQPAAYEHPPRFITLE